MRKLFRKFVFIFMLAFPLSVFAILSMELTQGVSGAIPVTVVPFATSGGTPSQNVSDVVANDLRNSGRFKLSGSSLLSSSDYTVNGSIVAKGANKYEISFSLVNKYSGSGDKVILSQKFSASSSQLRAVAHHISDLIYQKITGVRGVFSTRIAYVVVQRQQNGSKRYLLEVSDQDGENPRPLLNSPEPIMSPSWSPDGKRLAYVSFENRHAGIYLQDVSSGSRRLLSEFPGINGAPAWSPDGRKLAVVLSKSGAPNIYVMDVATHSLKQLTHDFYINTEPFWSPNGQHIIYTSNRSGGPQIYLIGASGGTPTRLTYDGDYNARGSFTKDGKHVAMIHRVNGLFKIAFLDLDTGTVKVLNKSAGDSASPSIAPNGSMVLYDTVSRGRNVLGMVSSDGRVTLELPARNGEAQDPAWSPYL